MRLCSSTLGPFGNQVKVVGIFDITKHYPVLNLGIRLVHGVLVRVVEFLEFPEKLRTCPRLYPEVIDVKIVPPARKRFLRHVGSPRI